MKFASPLYLLLLLVPAVFIYLRYGLVRKRKLELEPNILFSSLDLFKKKTTPLARWFHTAADILAVGAMVFLIIALARPLGGHAINSEKYFGIDIILAIDTSGSMLNVDQIPSNLRVRETMGQRVYYDPGHSLIKMNRINSVKTVIKEYIKKQTFNRIGMVIFAGYSYTKCPLTLDKKMLDKIVDDTHFAPENDGTAIGMGIATSVNRLKKSDAKSKVIILLTDGINNSGMIDPLSSANIARDLKIKIYTIGVGNPEGYLQPASIDFNEYVLQTGSGLDESILQNIAETTGGKFYRAYDPDSLRNIYNDIDKLEKSQIEIKRRVLYNENFMPFLVIGLCFLAAYIVLTSLVIRLP